MSIAASCAEVRTLQERIIACAELLEASGWCVAIQLDDDRIWVSSKAIQSLQNASSPQVPDSWMEFSRTFRHGLGRAAIVDEPHIKIWDGAGSDAPAPSKGDLTLRESEVFNLLKIGKTSPEIAIILSCSVRTAEKHVGNIYRKIGVRNRASVILEALTGEDLP